MAWSVWKSKTGKCYVVPDKAWVPEDGEILVSGLLRKGAEEYIKKQEKKENEK